MGGLLWLKTLGGPGGGMAPRAISVSGSDLLLAGDLYGSIDFGGGPLGNAGLHRPGRQPGNVVRLAEPGTSLDFGGGVLETDTLGFVPARFDATGTFLDNRFLDSAPAYGVAARGQRVAMIGQAGGALELGAGVISFGAGSKFIAATTP